MATEAPADGGWRALLRPEWLAALSVLLGGVLLHSMNVLLLATILPTIVGELGGAALMHWPTTSFLASSIVAATCTGVLTGALGARATFCIGALVFGVGALLCSMATAMSWVIAGRFVQGFGGGLLGAVAYVLVRNTFPEIVWSRAIALLSGMWSVSILVGPLAGGLFVRFGDWRSAFVAVAVVALLMAVGAFVVLPRTKAAERRASSVPAARIALVCLAIGGTSAAAVVAAAWGKAALIAAGIACLVAMVAVDRRASMPLFPSDAFSLRSPTGVGLWLLLLLSVTYSPLQIYVPIFLQRLHGLDPLSAGYAVAGASIGWTAAAVLVPSLHDRWPGRLIVLGPIVMAMGLLGLALLMTVRPVFAVLPGIFLLGAGIGMCWAFIAQRTMSGARPGDETVAASSVATVQQMGFAVGAAFAGLAANLSGLLDDIERATFWVPFSFVVPAVVALAAALRLRALR
ncbi:MAG: MFS transporter [Enhydrobacter sp.]|nr:MAG: MFS transporter [Enhydrobacter sp.]